jgi:putative ABC transport system ATP-binding protein
LIDLMRGLNRSLGVTFLFSTHDQRLLDHTGRIVWLCDGKVIEDTNQEEEARDAKVSVFGR